MHIWFQFTGKMTFYHVESMRVGRMHIYEAWLVIWNVTPAELGGEHCSHSWHPRHPCSSKAYRGGAFLWLLCGPTVGADSSQDWLFGLPRVCGQKMLSAQEQHHFPVPSSGVRGPGCRAECAHVLWR